MAAAAYADMRAASVTSKMEAGWIYTIFATHVTSNYDSYIGLQSFKASSKIFFCFSLEFSEFSEFKNTSLCPEWPSKRCSVEELIQFYNLNIAEPH